MSQIYLSQELARQIRRATGLVEFYDDTGHLLGYLAPPPERFHIEGGECPVSREELLRRESEEPTYTTQQVLDYLKSLGQS